MHTTERNGYQKLQVMTPPQRFADLHYRVSLVYLQHIQTFGKGLQALAAFQQDGAPGNSTLITGLLQDIQNADQALTQEVMGLTAKVPSIKVQQVLQEAQLGDLQSINQEIASLTTQLGTASKESKADLAEPPSDSKATAADATKKPTTQAITPTKKP
jgi:hypothetical protein